jgi:hypothetical protein
MANVFINLPVPAGIGSGAPADVSGMGVVKTLILSGPFRGAVVLEASEDGLTFGEVRTFTQPGVYDVLAAANTMRLTINSLGRVNGALLVPVTADLGAEVRTLVTAQLDVPAVNGAGAALDTSLHGPRHTFILSGSAPFGGSLRVEGSPDGTNWAPLTRTFTDSDVYTIGATVSQMRVVAEGFPGAVPAVTVAVVSEEPA